MKCREGGGGGGRTRLETCSENNQARFPPSINKGRNEGFEMMLCNYNRAGQSHRFCATTLPR